MKKIILILTLITGIVLESNSQFYFSGVGIFYGKNSGDGEYGNVGVRSLSMFGLKAGYDLLKSEFVALDLNVSYLEGNFAYDAYNVSYYHGQKSFTRIDDIKEGYNNFRVGLELTKYVKESSFYFGGGLNYVSFNCEDGNKASLGILLKIGFGKPEGFFIEGGFDNYVIEDLKFPGFYFSSGIRF